jgi:hypothetical protein
MLKINLLDIQTVVFHWIRAYSTIYAKIVQFCALASNRKKHHGLNYQQFLQKISPAISIFQYYLVPVRPCARSQIYVPLLQSRLEVNPESISSRFPWSYFFPVLIVVEMRRSLVSPRRRRRSRPFCESCEVKSLDRQPVLYAPPEQLIFRVCDSHSCSLSSF